LGERRIASQVSAPDQLTRPLAAARGLLHVIHPFPAFINAFAGAIFFAMAGGGTGGLVVMFLSVLLIHASIGSMNDFCDVDLDAKTKPDKPIVRGNISARCVMLVSVLAAVVGALLSLSFSWATLGIALFVLAAGLAYDFWAKATVLSWVPYAMAIPALPAWAFVGAGVYKPIVLISFPLGALMSLALNVANTIPDLEGDTRYGLRGIAHLLGFRRSLLAVWACFGLTIILLALTPAILGNNPTYLMPGVALGAVLLATMILDRLVNRSGASLRRGWYLSAALAAILGAAWVASLVPR
jgi:geranylgeranylglycerol-phosphate geranylgeranyltransferase